MIIKILIPILAFSGPWGKDADLCKSKKPTVTQQYCETPVLGMLSETVVSFHKKVISPSDGPRSHHRPTSSQYMLDATRKYGFCQGFMMGCDRLMRENADPWIYPVVKGGLGDNFKWDPVK